MPNDLIIFLVIAGIYFLQWIGKKLLESLRGDNHTPPGQATTEEERVRRFLEALGQDPNSQQRPTTAPPPVPPRRSSTPPPVPVRPVAQRPPLVPQRSQERAPATSSWEGETPAVASRDKLDRKVQDALRLLESGHVPTASATQQGGHIAVARNARTTAGVAKVRALFKNPESLRHVILAQEILSPPLSARE